uniref:Uncharacterized protein n=2 Tax=Caenorhabditis japonica TaxID=281687 RepID=A0A8R1IAX2_CAEJA
EALGSGEPDEDHRWPPGRRAKGRIVKNRPTWFPEKDYGLSMVQVKEEKGETWFKIKHNNYYEQRERMYWLSETHMNPVLIHEILGEVPYQLNCLLTMAHMSRMNEEFNTGAEWIGGLLFCGKFMKME